MNCFIHFLCICSGATDVEKERRELVIVEIDVGLQHLRQIYDETEMEALKEVDVMVCFN